MLEFFRRYQKIVYIVVTIVIVLSFSFFGTYSTFVNTHVHDPVVFKAVDGTPVTRSRLERMRFFIATDKDDLLAFGLRGANFLNDGVLTRDFLNTGLGLELLELFSAELKNDLDKRLQSEKHFALYEHPKAPFLSARTVWNYVLPEMGEYYDQLVSSSQALEPSALEARIQLYQSQRIVTPYMLRQLLAYQLRQYPWLTPDAQLEKGDLFLFGYHTVEDWFGPLFTRLAAQSIINGAALAQQKGYEVSYEEAWADLISHAQQVHAQLQAQNKKEHVESSETLLAEQLLALNMDQVQASALWRDVLLFRRLVHDMSGVGIVDALLWQQFVEYASTAAEGDIYRLPPALRLSTFRDLQKLSLYLNRVANVSLDSLELPTKYLSIQQIKKEAPALVQKRYRVKIAAIDKPQLRALVGLKETWDWEIQEENWKQLQKEMAEVGVSKAANKEERYAFLQQLDAPARKRIDQWAKERILEKHPEWVEEALSKAPAEEKILYLRTKGVVEALPGLMDAQALMQQLDQASIAQEGEATLKRYTPDNQHVYRITLLEKFPEEVLTFAQANKEGTLDVLLERYLEEHYTKLRQDKPELFRKADGELKSFKEASTDVAQEVFSALLKKINAPFKEKLTTQASATRRLYGYVEKVRKDLEKDSAAQAKWIASAEEVPTLETQWKLEKAPYRLQRSAVDHTGLNVEELLALSLNSYSNVTTPANGDVLFFHLQKVDTSVEEGRVAEKVLEAQRLLGDEGLDHIFHTLFKEWRTQGALSVEMGE